MPNIMIEFHKQHPGIKLDLFSLHTSMTIAALEEDNIDIGYVRLPVEAKGLRITPVHHEPLVVCLPRGHRLATRSNVRMEDLREERFILYERKWAPGFHDHVIELCREAGFQPVVAQQIDEMYLAATLVATGVGIAIIPRMVLSLPNDSIVVKPILGSSRARAFRTRHRDTIRRTFACDPLDHLHLLCDWEAPLGAGSRVV